MAGGGARVLEEIERKRAVTAEQGVGTMATRAKQRTDPSMTLNKLRELGVHELSVLCLNPSCGHEITFSADDYGDDTELSWFRPRMICARCGNRRLKRDDFSLNRIGIPKSGWF